MADDGRRERDFLSNLPRSLVEAILVRLSLKDAVRTSILSRDWRHKWINIPDLEFSAPYDCCTEYPYYSHGQRNVFNPLQLVNIIDQVLMRHSGPILTFKCNVCIKFVRHLHRWALFLVERGLEKLSLSFNSCCRRDSYAFPSYFTSCEKLTHLDLDDCIFRSNLPSQCLPYLRSLNLRSISFQGGAFNHLIQNSPCLKTLFLKDCSGIGHFHANAAKLEYLEIINCSLAGPLSSQHLPNLRDLILRSIKFSNGSLDSSNSPWAHLVSLKFIHCEGLGRVDINSPKLKTLVLSGDVEALKLEHTPSLSLLSFDKCFQVGLEFVAGK